MLTRRRRSGFSLPEILISLTVLAILGAMLTRFLISQNRFADQQNAMRNTRSVSRQAMNVLESELRMVQDSGGIDSAATDGKAIRVLSPFRFGLNCGVAGGATVVSLLPTDSMSVAQARYAGYAWRTSGGAYTSVLPAVPADTPVTSANPTQCTGNGAGQARIATVTFNGRAGRIVDLKPATALAPVGQAVFLFQKITYQFKTSTAYPGQYGLFRTVQGGPSEELIAPFDSAARFKYWTRAATASVAAPPALPLIRGVDIVFSARSSYTPQGKTVPSKSTLIASIFFRNVRS